MKSKNLFARTAGIVLAAALTTACVDSRDDVDYQFTESYSSCFNAVFDLEADDDAQPVLTDHPKYTFEGYRNSEGTFLSIKMINVKIGDIAYTSFDLPDIPLTITNNIYDPYLAEGKDLKPTNLSASTDIVFNEVKVRMLRRIIYTGTEGSTTSSQDYRPVYQVEMTVNNRYKIVAYPLSTYHFAQTKSINTSLPIDDENRTYQTISPLYAFTFDIEKQTAVLDITGAQFSEKMPKLNMSFPGIGFTCHKDGTLTLEAAELVPEIGNAPYPAYPISDLSAKLQPTKSGYLSFKCTIERMGLFEVEAILTDLN